MIKGLFNELFWKMLISVGVVSGTVIYLWLSGMDWRTKEEKITQQNLDRIADLLDRSVQNGIYEKMELDSEKDAWGRDIRVVYIQEGVGEHLRVSSSGKDESFNTEDDLVVSRWLMNATGIGQASQSYIGGVAKEAVKGSVDGLKESVKESIVKRIPWKPDRSVSEEAAEP